MNCSVIFYFSNQVAVSSDSQSSGVVEFILNFIPGINNMEEQDKAVLKEEILTPIIRKMAHFSLYALLGIFVIFFLLTYQKLSTKNKMMYTTLFCMFYAITDELHQKFVERQKCRN